MSTIDVEWWISSRAVDLGVSMATVAVAASVSNGNWSVSWGCGTLLSTTSVTSEASSSVVDDWDVVWNAETQLTTTTALFTSSVDLSLDADRPQTSSVSIHERLYCPEKKLCRFLVAQQLCRFYTAVDSRAVWNGHLYSVMRPRSSSRGRNKSASVTVIVTVTEYFTAVTTNPTKNMSNLYIIFSWLWVYYVVMVRNSLSWAATYEAPRQKLL